MSSVSVCVPNSTSLVRFDDAKIEHAPEYGGDLVITKRGSGQILAIFAKGCWEYAQASQSVPSAIPTESEWASLISLEPSDTFDALMHLRLKYPGAGA